MKEFCSSVKIICYQFRVFENGLGNYLIETAWDYFQDMLFIRLQLHHYQHHIRKHLKQHLLQYPHNRAPRL